MPSRAYHPRGTSHLKATPYTHGSIPTFGGNVMTAPNLPISSRVRVEHTLTADISQT